MKLLRTFTLFGLLAAGWYTSTSFAQAGGEQLFKDNFDYPDGLLTNEFAFENPEVKIAPNLALWEVTSGSLFGENGTGFTGIPDRGNPGIDSKAFNDSCVFRCRTKAANFGDVEFSVDIFNRGFTSAEGSPEKPYDGIHLWLRYASDKELYSVTVNRRDNIAVVKKKVPGGPSNGGTYITLKQVPYSFPLKAWQHFTTSARNNADGSVTLKLAEGGNTILSVVDTGQGGAPLTGPGRVGVRGDNCQFQFDNVVVRTLP